MGLNETLQADEKKKGSEMLPTSPIKDVNATGPKGHEHNGLHLLRHKKHPVNGAPQDDTPQKLVVVTEVSKGFDGRPILRDVSLDVIEGETVAILGKSGTGKSVTLKLIVALLTPDSGTVTYRGEDVSKLSEKELDKVRSNMGFLFQGAALFDSMTVGENLDLFLVKHTDLPAPEREEKIAAALEVVGLKDVIDSMPSELSGGMKKRAGLARSIVTEPELILYDEPTTGLDPVTAASIAELILSLQYKLGVASVVVTHDLPTAYTVADRAIILNDGYKIFDGKMEDLANSDDAFLKEYLNASKLDRTRREAIIAQKEKLREEHFVVGGARERGSSTDRTNETGQPLKGNTASNSNADGQMQVTATQKN